MKKNDEPQTQKKHGRPPAKWLLDLKPGSYTLSELESISKRTKGSIVTMFKRIGVKKKMGQNVCRNLHEVIYIWEGFNPQNHSKRN